MKRESQAKFAQGHKLPLEMLFHWEKTRPNDVFMRQPHKGSWQNYTWKQAADIVRRIAGIINTHRLPPKSHIAILSKNSAHWILVDLAIWLSGHVSIPLYPNIDTNTLQQILSHSEARLLFVGKLDSWESLEDSVPSEIEVIFFADGNKNRNDQWQRQLNQAIPIEGNTKRDYGELATIIYTSGTTGRPKGVMHEFSSVTNAGTLGPKAFKFEERDRFFSYLPLAHVAERALIEVCALYCGGMISFAESIETFADNLRETQPHIFLGVPRIWEVFQSRILEKLPQAKLDRLLSIPIVATLVKRKLRNAIGLNQCKTIISGAAPISVGLLEWYKKIGLDIQEGYAMTENFLYCHISRPDKIKIGWAGQPLPHVKVKINQEHEICVDCPTTTTGYYKEPLLTEDLFDGEFIKTGDLGDEDDEKFIKVSGRIKELFKTTTGLFVAPAPIEMKLKQSPMIEQACVVGRGLYRPLALINLAAQSDINKNQEKIESELTTLIEKINTELPKHEIVSHLVVIDEAWSIENEFLTPTLKIKRNRVEEVFGNQFERWSKSKSRIIW